MNENWRRSLKSIHGYRKQLLSLHDELAELKGQLDASASNPKKADLKRPVHFLQRSFVFRS